MSYPTQTQAIVAREPNGRVNWQLESIRVRSINNGEVLVEVVASGICHTDIGVSMRPIEAGGTYPRVFGHEATGVVREVGPGVGSVNIGDPVLLSFAHCKRCALCKDGHPAYCRNFIFANYVGGNDTYLDKDGTSVQGGFFGQSSLSNWTVASESCVTSLAGIIQNPEELKIFAPLGCGFQTGAASLLRRAAATPADTVAVMGLGGVGMAAIMAAKVTGCREIVAIDIVPSRLEIARELGATSVINSQQAGSNLKQEVLKISDNLGPSIIIEATGVMSVIESALGLLAPLGKLVIAGVSPPNSEIPLNLTHLMMTGVCVMSSVEGDATPSEYIPRMIEWYRQGNFPLKKMVKFYQANEFESALQDMKAGNVIKPVLLW